MKIGFGYDSHRFAAGRRLMLGGVEIPYDRGLAGHSDADVLCHAIIDAILGAMNRGDIGGHFPDTDAQWKNARSTELLKQTVALAGREGFAVSCVDSTVLLEEPRLSPYIGSMKESIARTGISIELISIKAKTNEGMGFVGRGEGVAAFAVCLLKKL